MGAVARIWRKGMGGAALGLLLAPCGWAHAASSVLIWPIDPVIEAKDKAAALWLENRGETPASLQVRVFAWSQGDFDDQYQPQREVVGSPPVATIGPGQKQMIRLTRLANPPPGQEQAYRIIIDEIPPALPVGQNGDKPQAAIRFQMRYSVPLFVYGEGLNGKPAEGQAQGAGRPSLSWRQVQVQGKPYVEIRNSGPLHARLTDVALHQGSQANPLVDGLLGYVLPGASMRWPAPATVTAATVLKGRVNGVEPAQTIEQGR